MRNEPSKFWFWDEAAGEFVENEQLGEIGLFRALFLEEGEKKRTRSYTRVESRECSFSTCEYIDGEFICVEWEWFHVENENGTWYEITEKSELVDREMQVVEIAKNQVEVTG